MTTVLQPPDDMQDEFELSGSFDSVFNRSKDDSDRWSYKAIYSRTGEVDITGVYVPPPASKMMLDTVSPLHINHLRTDKRRYAWGYNRMSEDGRSAYLEGSFPNTRLARELIEQIEYNESYGKGGISAGMRYNRAELRRPTPEEQAFGAKSVLPRAYVAEVSYIDSAPTKLESAKIELYQRALLEEKEAPPSYIPSQRLQEVFKRRPLDSDSASE